MSDKSGESARWHIKQYRVGAADVVLMLDTESVPADTSILGIDSKGQWKWLKVDKTNQSEEQPTIK